LSRTEQLKDCTAASRVPFAYAPPQRHGPRSYPLYSSDSQHSPGKTLVFPRQRQFLALQLCCLMIFCKLKKFLLIPLKKIFQKLWMPLLLLCLGTILASSCPVSCQPSSSPPPLSGSVIAASSHLSSRSTMAPTQFCTMALAPSPSESGHGKSSSPSAASRSARQQTPSLAARAAAEDRRVRAQVVLPQPRGSHFQTLWYLHLPLWHRLETVPEPFSYLARRFLHARDWRRHHRCHRHGTCPVKGHCHRGWTSDLFSSLQRPELGGSPVDTCLHPWSTVRPVRCTPITLYRTCI
jgi:hypothetical protein